MMLRSVATVTQGGADTATAQQFVLPYLGTRQALRIKGLRAVWQDIATVGADDYHLTACVATQSTLPTEGDDEWLIDVQWAAQNTAGVAVLVTVQPVLLYMPPVTRLTVQPDIYAIVSSSNTSQANDVMFELFFEVEKISEVEYYRLLAGGA